MVNGKNEELSGCGTLAKPLQMGRAKVHFRHKYFLVLNVANIDICSHPKFPLRIKPQTPDARERKSCIALINT